MASETRIRQRPIGIRELRRRQERLRRLIADQLRELRLESGASQVALAQATGLDQAHVSRIERSMTTASLDSIVALAAVLGADVSVRLFPTASTRIRDHLQAAMIEALVRRLHPRWVATPELPVPAARGVIDLAIRERAMRTDAFRERAMRERDGLLAIACEAHSQLRSIDLVLRRLHEKTLALADLEGPEALASSLLLVRNTRANRDLVRLHASTFAAGFPGGVRDALDALSGGTAEWPGPTLLWVRVEGGRAELLGTPPRGVTVGR